MKHKVEVHLRRTTIITQCGFHLRKIVSVRDDRSKLEYVKTITKSVEFYQM